MNETGFATLRHEMVEMIAAHTQMVAEIIGKPSLDRRVMEAMVTVPRHAFVPDELKEYAYHDTPLPIGHHKTISQPFIVALMTDLLDVQPDDTVLEVGTGLGYQAAVLSTLARRVYSLEIIAELADEARGRLDRLGFGDVVCRLGDGSRGWPEHAPFDKIMLTAAPEMIPAALLGQLKPGGRMVLPSGPEDEQILMLVEKDARGRITTSEVLPVRFSTMIVSH